MWFSPNLKPKIKNQDLESETLYWSRVQISSFESISRAHQPLEARRDRTGITTSLAMSAITITISADSGYRRDSRYIYRHRPRSSSRDSACQKATPDSLLAYMQHATYRTGRLGEERRHEARKVKNAGKEKGKEKEANRKKKLKS